MPLRDVWRNTAAALDLEASALSLASEASAGSRFSRLAYHVTVGGVKYTASGLLSEATLGGDGGSGNASRGLGARRGVFIWLHGSESLRAAAPSRTVTAGADGVVTSNDGQQRVPPSRDP